MNQTSRKLQKALSDGTVIVLEHEGIYCLADPSGQICQTVAVDRDDYAYTHGGALYQEACEAWWAWRGV